MKTAKFFLLALCAIAACSCAKEQGDRFYQLRNASGMEVTVTNFGGRITAIVLPDKDGIKRDVVLGFDKVEDYYPENNQTDFGASIGRYANRINQGKFTLDGVEYSLPTNNFGHTLHGGPPAGSTSLTRWSRPTPVTSSSGWTPRTVTTTSRVPSRPSSPTR